MIEAQQSESKIATWNPRFTQPLKLKSKITMNTVYAQIKVNIATLVS